jgi:hypothetical protein
MVVTVRTRRDSLPAPEEEAFVSTINTKTRAARPPFVKTGRMPRGMRPVSTTFIHVPAGARTRDLRIKSPLLYQLSYRDGIPLTENM